MLSKDYPHMPQGEFSKVSDDGSRASFTFSQAGAIKAVALAGKTGDSWYITGFAACNKLLLAAQGGQP